MLSYNIRIRARGKPTSKRNASSNLLQRILSFFAMRLQSPDYALLH
ncbi:hypothetical protein HMPREF6745_1551 [Prevotella sp. oral taxon 472 str. F0295]|nr:hypothetical protein HMPREF6745_1551 [Prevotella sp. oral taxon 472 str. F0295]